MRTAHIFAGDSECFAGKRIPASRGKERRVDFSWKIIGEGRDCRAAANMLSYVANKNGLSGEF